MRPQRISLLNVNSSSRRWWRNAQRGDRRRGTWAWTRQRHVARRRLLRDRRDGGAARSETTASEFVDRGRRPPRPRRPRRPTHVRTRAPTSSPRDRVPSPTVAPTPPPSQAPTMLRRSRRRPRRRPRALADGGADGTTIPAPTAPPTPVADGAPTRRCRRRQPTPVPNPVPTVAACTNGVLDTAQRRDRHRLRRRVLPGLRHRRGRARSRTTAARGGASARRARPRRRRSRRPRRQGALPFPAPTTPSPTPLPTPAPTRTPVVQVSLGVSGIDCDGFDQTVYDEACEAVLSNSTFEDATCAPYADGTTGVTLTSRGARAARVHREHVRGQQRRPQRALARDGDARGGRERRQLHDRDPGGGRAPSSARRRRRSSAPARRAAAVDGERAGRLGRGRDVLADARAVAASIDAAVGRAVTLADGAAVARCRRLHRPRRRRPRRRRPSRRARRSRSCPSRST